MFWVGVTFAFAAIFVTFVKEIEEGKGTDRTILYLSIGELVLAILSVLMSLSKHAVKHNTIIKFQKNLKTDKVHQELEQNKSNRRTLYIFIGASWLFFVTILVGGLVCMHFLDDTTHQYLNYTKYTTVITLFVTIILDAIISDVMGDAHAKVQIDQCKLLIHQLKAELEIYLLKDGNTTRSEELEKFISNFDSFSINNNQHFIKITHDKNKTLQEEGMEKNNLSPGKKNKKRKQRKGEIDLQIEEKTVASAGITRHWLFMIISKFPSFTISNTLSLI